jgi:hypothetical protein
MIRERQRFPEYVVTTLRHYGGSVYIPNVNLSHYEAEFAKEVNQTPENKLKELEVAFADLCFYLQTKTDINERAYYLRLLAIVARKICAYREVDYLISTTTKVIFEKNGTQVSDSNQLRLGTSLRL